jgi:hypothetical protein
MVNPFLSLWSATLGQPVPPFKVLTGQLAGHLVHQRALELAARMGRVGDRDHGGRVQVPELDLPFTR